MPAPRHMGPITLLASIMLSACQTPKDPSPLPQAQAAQLSAAVPATTVSGSRLYTVDGQQLKAYSLPALDELWRSEVGFFWNPELTVSADGAVYLITYDPSFPPDRPDFVIRGYTADGLPLGTFELNQVPTAPLLLPDGTLVIGLSARSGGAVAASVSSEPSGAKLIALSPSLELRWSVTGIGDLLRPPVRDDTRIYVADTTAVRIYAFDGADGGSSPLADANQSAQLAATGSVCYVLQTTQLSQLSGVAINWEVPVAPPGVQGTLQCNADGAYFIQQGGKLLALAASDGGERWSADLPAATRYWLELDSAGRLFAMAGGGEAGSSDSLLAFDGGGGELWAITLTERHIGPATAADGLLALPVSPVRDARRTQQLLLDPATGELRRRLIAREASPLAVVNGQSTLNPPWPALR